MLKVLLVDDELLVRTNLKCMVDWQAFGMSVCGEASNGAEALSLIKKMTPDIVITDMRMPVMDGLELSKELKQQRIDSILIILSNYDDFEYVKGTLKNGALDYIMKHNLNKSTLGEVLLRAKEKAGEKNLAPLSKNYSLNNLLALKEKFIINLLSGFFRHEEEVIEQLLLLDIPLHTKNLMATAMVVDDYNKTLSKSSLQDSSIFELSIINIVEEILTDAENGAVCHIQNEKYVILSSFENVHSGAKISALQNHIFSRIQTCLKKFLNMSVSFSIGPLCSSILRVHESFEAAEKMLENRFFEGKSCILHADNSNEFNRSITGLEIDVERQLYANLQAEESRSLLTILHDVFRKIKESKLSVSNSQIIFSDLLSLLNRVCKEKEIAVSSVYESNEAPHILLSRLDTIDDVENWFIGIFEKLYGLIHSSRSMDQYSENVRNAINYITRNYAKEITLSGVAEAIDVSSVYLSKLFKKETGTGFSEFLCDLRLDKAKLLLEEGKEDIKNIVKQCGFNNYAYFFNVFKQKTGLTPKEYISECRKK